MAKNTDIVPSDTKYVPLTQQPFCCVPTCIQMIMLRRNIPLLPAEVLGFYMGLTVPKIESAYFWNPRTGVKPKSGYGTQIGKKQYNPNYVFKKLCIPLKMNLVLIDKFNNFNEFKNYLISIEKTGKDILVCYDWGILFNKESHNGHVCVLDKVFNNKNAVRIIDPECKTSKWKIVKIKKLYSAMVFHGKEKSAGFWEFSHAQKLAQGSNPRQ